jgi:predicted amidohydrolase YtcJ
MNTILNFSSDIVLINGFIYTLDDSYTSIEAMAIKGSRIVFTGRTSEAEAWIGSKTRVIDLKGKMVLPGFVDSHCHISSGVCEISEPILHNINNIDGYLRAVRDFAFTNPDLVGIQAGGWVNAVFDTHGPAKEILDVIVPNIPVVLFSEDYHNAWVNSKTLELAGITANTPDPTSGLIERDPKGNPSGTLRESAVDLVKKTIPAYTVAQVREGLDYFQKKAHSLGITTVYNPLLSIKDQTDLQAFHQWEQSGKMKLRVPSAAEVEPGDSLDIVEELNELRNHEHGEYFKILAAKIFMDGVLEGGTAFLEEPYLHIPGSRGILNWEPAKFNHMCVALDRTGLQIHVHSIGDAATRITLDGFTSSLQHNGKRDSRHAITHIQLVNIADINRFADLGVIAVPQPYWFVMDANYDQALKYIGQERASRQYPMKSFMKKGVVVASASDYNVTLHPNPLVAIEMGVTRSAPGADHSISAPDFGGILVPHERVTAREMIASFTKNGAYAAFLENEIGSLKVGKKADFIILDQDIIKIKSNEIHNVQVLFTAFDGQEVYRHGSFND